MILLMRAHMTSQPLLIGAFLGAIGFVLVSPVVAGEVLEGPIRAVVERVVDGDTLSVRARIWLGQDVHVMVRLAGIDAPEMRGRCEEERAQARAATDYLKRFEGSGVVLSGISNGKFAGRVVAAVRHPQEGDLGEALLSIGLARVYDGGRRVDWCGEPIAQAPSPADG